MKTTRTAVTTAASLSVFLAMSASAAVRYVDLNNPAPAPPYTTWASAATNIQDAIDAALPYDEIVVTNGVYQTGGRAVDGSMTNRVAVAKPVTVRSVNGPEVTVIEGYKVPGGSEGLGDSAVRCVYLTNSAALVGFTLTNGATRNSGFTDHEAKGGGVWCESDSAVVSNCVLSGNSAYRTGGGGYRGTLNNCTLTGNTAFGDGGGGAYQSTLNNCTVMGNVGGFVNGGGFGGGANQCTLNNCIVTSNAAGFGGGGGGGGAAFSTLNNCTITGNAAGFGGGVYQSELNNCTLAGNCAVSYFYRFIRFGGFGGGTYGGTLNNCIGYFNVAEVSGDNYSEATFNYSCTTPLPTNGVGNITNEPAFVDLANGTLRLRPGSPCIDAATNLSAIITNDLDGRPRPVDGDGDGTAVFDMGAYEYRALHVWQESPSPAPPYGTWGTAATNIQDAIDGALPGDDIVVTNGIYQTGGRVVDFTMNRVAVNKLLTLRSVNGPEVTVIRGESECCDSGVRCVYLTNEAVLVGFTLTNGLAGVGGGVWCESASAVVSNCVLTGNSAGSGGGAYQGTLNNCRLSANVASVFGGGADGCTLNNCTLTYNIARHWGGGAYEGTLNKCTLSDNWAGYGGGVFLSTLNNCTLYGNTAWGGANGFPGGGGAHLGTLNNCIVYYNSSPDYLYVVCNHSCTTPPPTNGVGNFTNAPLFVDQAGGDFRLQANSPCINAGLNAYAPAGLDLDGNPRIVGGTVDVGAYEFQSPQSAISYAWLQGYGLPTDGSVDFTDADSDGLNNWQEWRCLTDPTNAHSVLRLLSPSATSTNVTVSWPSAAGVSYFLERSTNLTLFTPLATNVPGQPGTTIYTDTNSSGAPRFFYRVGVE